MDLKDKTIVFLGSSITYGSGSNGWSMCEYIKESMGCNTVKWAVPGTTLADVDDISYVSRLKENILSLNNCDVFVCQLSTNDAAGSVPYGSVSPDFERDSFDTKTTAGAIEYIVSLVRETFNCPVVFYTGTYISDDRETYVRIRRRYEQLIELLAEIKEKWNFEVIDLWNNTDMRKVSQMDYNKYMYDAVHPSRLGYEKWWGPKFFKFLHGRFSK